MTIRRLYRPSEFLAVLHEAPMLRLQALLIDGQGRFPSRRTWERRLARLPESLPDRIALIGQQLVAQIRPWTESGRAVALDSTVFRALGGVWHKTHREKGEVPHTRIDTEAARTKSGYHGWVYAPQVLSWKLHVAITVASVWIPVAARLRPANEADNVVAEGMLPNLPAEARFVVGDRHDNAPNIREACEAQDLLLVASRHGAYPHTDAGVEVRRIFHKLRSATNENFNEQYKNIFNGHDQVPTKGLLATQRYALGAVLLYQIVLWHRHEHKLPLREGLKAFIRAL